MEKQTNKHKMSGGVKALLIILVILFLLVGVPFLYLSFGGYSFEDAEAAAGTPPMASAERYRFHAGDETEDILVTPGDLWWVTRNTDMSDEWDSVYETLETYGLTLKSYGLTFGEGNKAFLDAKLIYKNFLPIPVRAETSFALSGKDLAITVDGISIGRLIHIDPATLPIGEDMLTFTLNLTDVHTRMEQLQTVKTENGNLVLTCGVGRELVAELLENLGQAEADALYMGDNEPLLLARTFAGRDHGMELAELLSAWEKDGGAFVDFKRLELVYSEDFKAGLYFTCEDGRFLPRFLPEITAEQVQADSDAWYGERVKRYNQIVEAVENLAALNEARGLTLDTAAFLNTAGDGGKLELSQLAGTSGPPDWIEGDSVRFILGQNANYYMTNALDPIKKMPLADKAVLSVLSGLDGNKVYVPLVMLRTANDRPAVAYVEKGGTFTMRQLVEDQYTDAMAKETMPVFDLKLED